MVKSEEIGVNVTTSPLLLSLTLKRIRTEPMLSGQDK